MRRIGWHKVGSREAHASLGSLSIHCLAVLALGITPHTSFNKSGVLGDILIQIFC